MTNVKRNTKPCRYCGTTLKQPSGGTQWRDEEGKSVCPEAPPTVGVHRVSNAVSSHLKRSMGK